MNKYEIRRQRISEEVRLIVAGAPSEMEKRSEYVNGRCVMLADAGWSQADYREVEELVRVRLGLEPW